MTGIEPDLYNRLQETLLNCGSFESDHKLKAIFVDGRIVPWADQVPETSNVQTRIQETITWLSGQARQDTNENGLVLLLRVLSDQKHSDDKCHHDLVKLANELEIMYKAHGNLRQVLLTQIRGEDFSLRLVDISIDEPPDKFPLLDIKLRNVGSEVVFLKRVQFNIIKTGRFVYPYIVSYCLEKVSWNYDVQFNAKHENISIAYEISQSISPNAVDRFTFTISQSGGDPVLPTLFYFTVTLIYNEDDRKIISQPIILLIPSSITWAGMNIRGFNKNIAKQNLVILREFSELQGLNSEKVKLLIEKNLEFINLTKNEKRIKRIKELLVFYYKKFIKMLIL